MDHAARHSQRYHLDEYRSGKRYSDMYAMDADAFNSVNRARTNIDIDLTALARYEPNRYTTFEMGYARKTRAPNLYERYAWSTDWMITDLCINNATI